MKKILIGVLALFLVADICFSFVQHYRCDLDGDLSSIVVPAKAYETVMKDPFAMNVLLHDSAYCATNRFFAHKFMATYFRTMPFALQKFTDPINSVYLSAAIIKIAVQVLLIYLLTVYATNKTKIWDIDFLIVAALITPLFQNSGYFTTMGIIDPSITYVFFYPLALFFLLVFFFPFFRKYYHQTKAKINLPVVVLLIIFSVFCAFHGPLNPAILLLICPFALAFHLISHFNRAGKMSFIKKISFVFKNCSRPLVIVFGFATIVSLYSFWAGTYNLDNRTTIMPLSDRYRLLFEGIWVHLTYKLGLGSICGLMILNGTLLFFRWKNPAARKLLTLLFWITIFSIVYTLLLPLGGYRPYRPLIIRSDTLMPIVLISAIFIGSSTLFLIRNISVVAKSHYIPVLLVFVFIFTNADRRAPFRNKYEIENLTKISKSPYKCVYIDNQGCILSWWYFKDYIESECNGKLLYYWGITDELKYYAHHQEKPI